MEYLIRDDYYDLGTHALLLTTLTEEDKEYMKCSNDGIIHSMFKRWRMIVNSFPSEYYRKYRSLTTAATRNFFIKKYLNLDNYNIDEMPDLL